MALRFHTYRHMAAKYTQLLQTELALYYSDLTVKTWEVHMTTVVTEGGCYSNVSTGMCSVLFQRAVHL